MLKNIFFVCMLILLNNCAPTGSAFLGPSITVAKTGNISQAALSYTSNKALKNIKTKKNKAFKVLDQKLNQSLATINNITKVKLKNNANNFFDTVKDNLENNRITSFN